MGVGLDHLQGLYAETSDPWGFEHSAYEQAKFAATRAALAQMATARPLNWAAAMGNWHGI